MSKYVLTDTTTETPIIHHINNDVVIQAEGTFNGGTLMFEYSQDGLDFVPLDDFSITKADALAVSPADTCDFKIKLDGATTGASVTVSVLIRRCS